MLHHIQKKVLIIVPTISLTSQMVGDFADYSSLDPSFNVSEMCHIIQGGEEKDHSEARIYVSTWQSIFRQPESWFRQFEVIIGDEAHLFQAKSLVDIMKKSSTVPYRYGMSGTLSGAKTHELVLEGIFGPIHHVTKTISLMERGDLAELDISMIVLNWPKEISSKLKKAKYKDEIDFLVSSEKRNKFIANLALDRKGNTLVLFQYVDKHGRPLFDLIRSKAHDERKVFYVSGSTDSETRESIRHITESEKDAIIVASIGTFSTGINIRNLHNIIFASPSKSQIRVLQSIGRGLRKSDNGSPTKLYDIVDNLSHGKHRNFTLNHGIERVKIYTQEKFKYKNFEVDL
jgi:superfamily II DNA or RNA helicase